MGTYLRFFDGWNFRTLKNYLKNDAVFRKAGTFGTKFDSRDYLSKGQASYQF